MSSFGYVQHCDHTPKAILTISVDIFICLTIQQLLQ